jgi:hypothetical protein
MTSGPASTGGGGSGVDASASGRGGCGAGGHGWQATKRAPAMRTDRVIRLPDTNVAEQRATEDTEHLQQPYEKH